MDKIGFAGLNEKLKETASNATKNLQEKAMNKLVSTLESAENFDLNEYISSLTSGPEMRNVNVNKNSDILGNKLRAKFKQYMEDNGLSKVIDEALTGFQSYFDKEIKIDNHSVKNSSLAYMKQCVGGAIQEILITFVTLSVNTKEHKFKTDLFRKVLAKIPKEFSYKTDHHRYMKKKISENESDEPSKYYKTLMENIGQKMVNILKTYRGGVSGGARGIQQLGGSPDDDDTPDMDCFINNRSAQIIREFFEYNVSSKDIMESISTEIIIMLFTIYNDQDIREKICRTFIDPKVDTLIQYAVDDIIELFCTKHKGDVVDTNEVHLDFATGGGGDDTIQLPLETLYVLLDDPYIQRIIRNAGYSIANDAKKLSVAFLPKKTKKQPENQTEKQTKEAEELFNNIVSTLQNPKFSTKPAKKSRLDRIIDWLSPKEPVGSTKKQTGGDEKIHIGPSDYNIVLIISTIVSETMEDISKRLGESLNKTEIQDIIVAFFTDEENQKNFITDAQMDDVYNTLYKCLFETFTDTFRLHVFYMNNMYTKTLEIDDPKIFDKDDNNIAREQYVQSNDPEWIINAVGKLVDEAAYKNEGPVLIKAPENPNRSDSRDKVENSIPVENTDNKPPTSMTSNAEKKPQFNIAYQQEPDKKNLGQWVPSNHPQINSIISKIMLSHFISAFKDKKTHEKIEPITTEIIEGKMASISNNNYKTQHPPFSLLLRNCFQKPKEQKEILFENPDTNVIQLLKKVLRKSLLGFDNIPSSDDIILPNQKECIRFAVFCYLSDYLYTGSQTNKVNRTWNLGALHFQSNYSMVYKTHNTILSDVFIHVFQEGKSDKTVTKYLTEYSTNLVNSNNISASGAKLSKSMVSNTGKEITRLANETISVMPVSIQKLISKKESSSNPTILQAEFVIPPSVPTSTVTPPSGTTPSVTPPSDEIPFTEKPITSREPSGGKSTKRRHSPHTKNTTRKRKNQTKT